MANTTHTDIVYLQPPIKAVSVIIPCKNEEQSVRLTVKSITDALNPLDIDYEIIVVDDSSTDKTREEAIVAGQGFWFITLTWGMAILLWAG